MTVWLHGALVLPQQSVACHLRVIRLVHPDAVALVKVLIRVMVTFVPQQASEAVGGSKPGQARFARFFAAQHAHVYARMAQV